MSPEGLTLNTERDYANAIGEVVRRRQEAIHLYRAMPSQLPFHLSKASEKVVRGGNRCLGGEQEIYDPVLGCSRRIDLIDRDFHVLTKDPSTGESVVAKASRPFIKGRGDLYEVTLSNGETLVATLEHRVLDADGRWVSLRSAFASSATLYVSEAGRCGHGEKRKVFQHRRQGECLDRPQSSQSTTSVLPSPGATLSESDGSRLAAQVCPTSEKTKEFVASHPLRVHVGNSQPNCHIASIQRLRQGYVWDIEVESHANYVAAGLVNANSGKTMTMMAEIASAVMGVPLRGPNGQELPFLYPRNRPLLVWLIGFDEKHIGRMWHKLFAPGMFKLIRDKETDELRSWRPWEPDDADREDETELAPPLIPERMIKEWAWENKAERAFTVCRLHNGTQIYAFTSGAEAATGDAVDIIGIDEAIKYPGHIAEWQARLSDNRGKLLWASWPRMANRALKEMSDRAAAQCDMVEPDVFEIVLRFSDNAYMPSDEKRKRLAGWSDVERRARDLGDFVTDLTLVYPSFNIDVHGLPSKTPCDRLETFLAKRNWQVPLDWTNYITVDPGHAHMAVLLASVPPPEIGDYLVVWGEICTPHLDAEQVAAEIQRLAPGRTWEAFHIDRRGGRRSVEQLGGVDIRDIWTAGFTKAGLKSHSTGYDFLFGLDDIPARNMLVREHLRSRHDWGPKLRLIALTTPETQKEFGLYSKHVTRDEIQDKVVDKDNHSMDALAYLVAGNPVYVRPSAGTAPVDPHLAAFYEARRRYSPKHTESVYMGPGAAPAPTAVASF